MNKHFKVAEGVLCYDSTIEINGKLFGSVALVVEGDNVGGEVFTITHVFGDFALAALRENLPAGWTADTSDESPYCTAKFSYDRGAESASPVIVLSIFPPITIEANAGQLLPLV